MNNDSFSITLYGITQDPEISNYMVVLQKMNEGSLRSNLMIKKYNPNDKYENLYDVAELLSALHKCNLVHGDFHSGNLLLKGQLSMHISDLGLNKPADKQMKFMEYFLILHLRFYLENHIQKLLIYILLVS